MARVGPPNFSSTLLYVGLRRSLKADRLEASKTSPFSRRYRFDRGRRQLLARQDLRDVGVGNFGGACQIFLFETQFREPLLDQQANVHNPSSANLTVVD